MLDLSPPKRMSGLMRREPKKHAVLIGIGYYNDQAKPLKTRRRDTSDDVMKHTDLKGCVNDILLVEKYLLDVLGFDQQDIKKLLAPDPSVKLDDDDGVLEPSYDNIIQALQSLPSKASAGDLVYIHYSGHGARATTIFPELKPNMTRTGVVEDEVLVPVDVNSGGNYIRDLEFALLLQKLVDAHLIVTVVLDCCYAGGAVRGDEEMARSVSSVYASDLERDLPASIDEIRQRAAEFVDWLEEPRGFVLLAACQKFQKATEMRDGLGKHFGALTRYLVDSLGNDSESITSQALYERVFKSMRDGCHNQTPHLIGEKSRLFFGRESLRHGLSVTRVDLDRGGRPAYSSVNLFGSSLVGVAPGSIYAILPFGFDLMRPIRESDILARVKIIEGLTIWESQAEFKEVKKNALVQIKEGCPAVLERLPPNKKLKVKVSEAVKEKVPDFREKWLVHDGDKLWLQLEDSGPAVFTIRLDQDCKHFGIEDHGGDFVQDFPTASNPLPLGLASSIPRLIRRIEHLARFKLIKNLKSPPSSLDDKVSFELKLWPEGVEDCNPKYRNKVTEIRRTDDGVYEVGEGKAFVFEIINKSSGDIGISLLDFCPEFSIQQSYPRYEDFGSVPSNGEPCVIRTRMCIPTTLSKAAKEHNGLEDTMKLFISAPPTPLRALSLPRLEDGERYRGNDEDEDCAADTLEELLQQEDSPFREAGCEGRRIIDKWKTISLRVRTLPLTSQEDVAISD